MTKIQLTDGNFQATSFGADKSIPCWWSVVFRVCPAKGILHSKTFYHIQVTIFGAKLWICIYQCHNYYMKYFRKALLSYKRGLLTYEKDCRLWTRSLCLYFKRAYRISRTKNVIVLILFVLLALIITTKRIWIWLQAIKLLSQIYHRNKSQSAKQ